MIKYRENLKELLGLNLLDIGWIASVDPEKVEECTDPKVLDLIEDLAPDGLLSLADAEKHSLESYLEKDALPFFDEYAVAETMADIIRDAKHYLVMAHGCRWDGASGYKIANSAWDALSRSYDVTIIPHSVSRGGKTLCCTEYSHDVPMGGRTTIIALTDREYEFLNHWDTSFEAVERFAAECEARMG